MTEEELQKFRYEEMRDAFASRRAGRSSFTLSEPSSRPVLKTDAMPISGIPQPGRHAERA